MHSYRLLPPLLAIPFAFEPESPKVETSMIKTEVFGDPIGDFLVDEIDGWMKNKKGAR